MKIILLILLFLGLHARILDIKQLFSKEIITPKVKFITNNKEYYAITKINEQNIFDITLRYSGFITKLNVNKTYQNIKKGDVLFKIYSDEVYSTIKELVSSNQRFFRKSISDKLDILEVAKKERYVKKSIKVYAKNNGFILDKNVNSGSFIKKGASIFKVANLDNIWVEADVYQEDLNLLKVGMSVEVNIDNTKYSSTIDKIYPSLNKQHLSTIRIILPNKNHKIKANSFAKVKVNLKKKKSLVLPSSSILTKGNEHFVFLALENTQYEPKLIDAQRIDSYTYKVTGIDKNTKVLNKAMFLLDSDAINNALYDNEEW